MFTTITEFPFKMSKKLENTYVLAGSGTDTIVVMADKQPREIRCLPKQTMGKIKKYKIFLN